MSARPREQGVTAQSAAQEVRTACRRWRNGEAVELWQEAVVRARRRVNMAGNDRGTARPGRRGRKKRQDVREEAERTQQARNIERAKTLLGEGQLSRAASALVS